MVFKVSFLHSELSYTIVGELYLIFESQNKSKLISVLMKDSHLLGHRRSKMVPPFKDAFTVPDRPR